jgi:hypothetical protein
MLKVDAFGLQPFLRDYLPDGGLRSPLSMPHILLVLLAP